MVGGEGKRGITDEAENVSHTSDVASRKGGEGREGGKEVGVDTFYRGGGGRKQEHLHIDY